LIAATKPEVDSGILCIAFDFSFASIVFTASQHRSVHKKATPVSGLRFESFA
jgi:hypothetical protein